MMRRAPAACGICVHLMSSSHPYRLSRPPACWPTRCQNICLRAICLRPAAGFRFLAARSWLTHATWPATAWQRRRCLLTTRLASSLYRLLLLLLLLRCSSASPSHSPPPSRGAALELRWRGNWALNGCNSQSIHYFSSSSSSSPSSCCCLSEQFMRSAGR